MSSAVLDYPAGVLVEHCGSYGVSNEAHRITRMFHRTKLRLHDSFTFGNQGEEMRNKLLDAWRDASKPGWDGYGAMSASEASLHGAWQFIDSLPRYIPAPDVSIDPDGEVSFDWYGGHRRQFSISIGGGGVISYAGLFGSDNVRGRERLEGFAIPHQLIQYISRAAS
jgi:hypothetical protein